LDYNGLGYSFLITKQFGKAIKALKEGENIDNTELAIKLNLAHAYLLNGLQSQNQFIKNIKTKT
jgi:hypothetical protein